MGVHKIIFERKNQFVLKARLRQQQMEHDDTLKQLPFGILVFQKQESEPESPKMKNKKEHVVINLSNQELLKILSP